MDSPEQLKSQPLLNRYHSKLDWLQMLDFGIQHLQNMGFRNMDFHNMLVVVVDSKLRDNLDLANYYIPDFVSI